MENISEFVYTFCDQSMEKESLVAGPLHKSRTLFSDDIDEAEEKEGGEEVEHPVSAKGVTGAAGEELQKRVAGEAEAEAVGDGPGKRDSGDGEEGGDGDACFVPVDGRDACNHEGADEDEGGCGGEVGDSAY